MDAWTWIFLLWLILLTITVVIWNAILSSKKQDKPVEENTTE